MAKPLDVELILPLHQLSLHNFASAVELSANGGAKALAATVADESRTERPEQFNALVLWTSAGNAAVLASKLEAVNQFLPH